MCHHTAFMSTLGICPALHECPVIYSIQIWINYGFAVGSPTGIASFDKRFSILGISSCLVAISVMFFKAILFELFTRL